MKVGYIRVSTVDQNESRQVIVLKNEGCEKIYSEKVSGKDMKRPELQKMLEFVRSGDIVIVSELSRLARSTSDLLSISQILKNKDVELVSLKEKIDTSTPTGRFTFTLFAAIAELERATILEKQREGIAIAKAEGKYKGRQPKPFNEQQLRIECKKWRNGEQSARDVMRKLNMSSNRFYRIVNRLGISKKDSET